MDSSEFYEKLLAHYEREDKRMKISHILYCVLYISLTISLVFFIFAFDIPSVVAG